MVLALPLPNGSLKQFEIQPCRTMAPGLEQRYPEIRTYRGTDVAGEGLSCRLDITPQGFHGQILGTESAVYIDPLISKETDRYASYYHRERYAGGWNCQVTSSTKPDANKAIATPVTPRTYRLAVATTRFYTMAHSSNSASPTVAEGLAAVVTAVNRINGIFERELGVNLELVEDNDQIIYVSSTNDPYDNEDGQQMLSANQVNLDRVIGRSNYDVGHVFSTWSGGGAAIVGRVCNSLQKAYGLSGLSDPTGDLFIVDIAAHELAHQFGANHTFNSELSNCSGNRHEPTAFEPGSGTTIMSYAGICGLDNIQAQKDDYFHSASIAEIQNYLASTGDTCGTAEASQNYSPTVDAGRSYTIPAQTPFVLEPESWDDPDGDTLHFCWEQIDLGPAQGLTDPDNGQSPLFRSRPPSPNPRRTFPHPDDLVQNRIPSGERLPTTDRSLRFRVTARDMVGDNGLVAWDEMQVNVAGASGPFLVERPNDEGTFSGLMQVLWDPAGTHELPVNAAQVRILLSIDGGASFPITLLDSTDNDGAETVVLPSLTTDTSRIRIEAVNNIFFDLSDTDFSIRPGSEGVFFTLLDDVAFDDEVGNGNGNKVIDNGENAIRIGTNIQNSGFIAASNVTGQLSCDLATVEVIVDEIDYGSLASGQTATNLAPFVVRILPDHPCGAPIPLDLAFSSDQGGNSTQTTLQTGRVGEIVLFEEDFESGLQGWTTSGLWHAQSQTSCVTPSAISPTTVAAYGRESSCTYDTGSHTIGNLTIEQAVIIPSGIDWVELRWWDSLETEDDSGGEYDRYAVRILGEGEQDWIDVQTGTLSRAAWSQQVVDLSPFIGQSVRIRFYFDSVDDQHNGFRGWYIDDVQLVAQGRICDEPLAGCVLNCGDLDGSGNLVNLVDFSEFSSCFGQTISTAPECVCANLIEPGDDVVNLLDLHVWLSNYLTRSIDHPPFCGTPLVSCTYRCGDLNGDGKADLRDYALLAGCFGKVPSKSDQCVCANLVELGEDLIDLADVWAWMNTFLQTRRDRTPNCGAPRSGCSFGCGDLNGDDRANFTDFALLMGCYGNRPSEEDNCICANLIEEGGNRVDFLDVVLLAQRFLLQPEGQPPNCAPSVP